MLPSQVTFAAGAVGVAGLPERVRATAEALSLKHGTVHVSREKHGLHLNMACPKCLETEGDRELQKRHLAVSADKACGTGMWGGPHEHSEPCETRLLRGGYEPIGAIGCFIAS